MFMEEINLLKIIRYNVNHCRFLLDFSLNLLSNIGPFNNSFSWLVKTRVHVIFSRYVTICFIRIEWISSYGLRTLPVIVWFGDLDWGLGFIHFDKIIIKCLLSIFDFKLWLLNFPNTILLLGFYLLYFGLKHFLFQLPFLNLHIDSLQKVCAN